MPSDGRGSAMTFDALEPDARQFLAERLRMQHTAGELRTSDIRVAARDTGLSERTLWRWLARSTPPRPRGRRGYTLTQADRDAYAAAHGNAAAAWRLRTLGTDPVPNLRVFQAAIKRELLPIERAAVSDGINGQRRHTVYLRWNVAGRNDRWETDHVELPILVLPPRGSRPRHPWVTLCIDAYSRLLMGWSLSLVPTAATVLTALRMGMLIDPARGDFGGVPRTLRPDRGLEFVANALAHVCAVLGVQLFTSTGLLAAPEGQSRAAGAHAVAGLSVHAAVLYGRSP
jgi:putative transposase